MRMLLWAMPLRPTRLVHFCNLAAFVVPVNFVNQWVARLFRVPEFASRQPQALFLISWLLSQGVLQSAVVGHLVTQIGYEYYNSEHVRTICELCFAPELAEAPAGNFEQRVRDGVAGWQQTWVGNGELALNGWADWRAVRVLPSLGNMVLQALIDDDVDALVRQTESPSCRAAARLESCALYPFLVLHGQPPLVSVAAFFGAVRCFMWLVSRGDLSVKDGEGRTVLYFAVAGGERAILQAVLHEPAVAQAGGAVEAAVAFARRDLFPWFEGEWTKKYDVIGVAAMANNIEFIQRLIDEGCDVNCQNTDARVFPLYRAAAGGCIEAVRLLARADEIDFTLKVGESTAAECAARMNEDEILEIILTALDGDKRENAVGRCWDAAFAHSAGDSLRCLYKINSEVTLRKLKQAIRESARQLGVLTMDTIEFFWSILDGRYQQRLFAAALRKAMLLIVYWVICNKNWNLNDKLMSDIGPEYPIFLAIEGGARVVTQVLKLSKGLRILSQFNFGVVNRNNKPLMELVNDEKYAAIKNELLAARQTMTRY
jgi:hypothetical protein